MSKGYITENFTTNISVDEYILRFRDEKRFVEFCKQCPNYGNSWGCPPFDFDTGEFLRQYKYAYLMATKIVPIEKGIPIGVSNSYFMCFNENIVVVKGIYMLGIYDIGLIDS